MQKPVPPEMKIVKEGFPIAVTIVFFILVFFIYIKTLKYQPVYMEKRITELENKVNKILEKSNISESR